MTSETKMHPPGDPSALVWDMMVELRKEILEGQKIRAQIVAVKVTFVSAAFGVIAANLDKKIHLSTLAAPACAAIFFDFLIASYSFSIKRIGYYLCEYLEKKVLQRCYSWPEGMLLWQDFLNLSKSKHGLSLSGQSLALLGNVGMTALATTLGGLGLWFGEPRLSLYMRIGLIVLLGVFFVASVYAYLRSWEWSFDNKHLP
jgi:hypothetical protein